MCAVLSLAACRCQTALVMSHVDLEDELPKLRLERDTLSKTAASAEVFQAGLTQMRSMLDQEIEKNQKLQDNWEQLQHMHIKSHATQRAGRGETTTAEC